MIVERLINKYVKLLPKFEAVIQNSFLSAELKEKYGELLRGRLDRLGKIGASLQDYRYSV